METKQKPFGEVVEELDRELRSWQITVENKDREIAQLKAELQSKTQCSMGVGDGGGNLFVYGDYDSIKAAQKFVLQAVGAGGVQPLRTSTVSPVWAESAEGLVPVAAYDRLQALCDAQAARLLALEDASVATPATIETVAVGNEDVQDLVSKALRKAWQLGKTYWQQADSEFLSQQVKSDVTQAKFQELVDETSAAISTQPAADHIADAGKMVAAVAVGEREAFERAYAEAWNQRDGFSLNANALARLIKQDRDGETYKNPKVGKAWADHQARAALATTPPNPCDTPSYCNSIQRCTSKDEQRAKAEMQAEPVATQVPASICEELDNVLTDPDSKLSPGAERALRWMRSWVSVPLFTPPQATQQDALDAHWIRADEKLPGEQGQDSEEVMLFLNGDCSLTDFEARQGGGWGIRLGYFDAEKQAFRVHGRPDSFVTHWMPLPQPPAIDAAIQAAQQGGK